jgi:hypothetical protein
LFAFAGIRERWKDPEWYLGKDLLDRMRHRRFRSSPNTETAAGETPSGYRASR